MDFGIDEEPEPDREEVWKHMRGRNVYPRNMPELKGVVGDAMAGISDVGSVIVKAYALGLGLSADHFKQFFKRESSHLCFLKYPPTQGEKIGIGEH